MSEGTQANGRGDPKVHLKDLLGWTITVATLVGIAVTGYYTSSVGDKLDQQNVAIKEWRDESRSRLDALRDDVSALSVTVAVQAERAARVEALEDDVEDLERRLRKIEVTADQGGDK